MMALKLVVFGSEITRRPDGRETSACFACLQTKRNLDRANVKYEYVASDDFAAKVGRQLFYSAKPIAVVFDDSEDYIFIDDHTKKPKDNLDFLHDMQDSWYGLNVDKINEVIELLESKDT